MDISHLLVSVALITISFFLGRFLKGRGKIRIGLIKWRLIFGKPDGMGGSMNCDYEGAEHGRYWIELDFFNEKDIQTAIKKPSILFKGKKGKIKYEKIISHQQESIEPIEGINLLPRKLVNYGWHGYLKQENLAIIMNSDKVYFWGYLPNGKKIKKLIIKEPLYSLLKDYYRESVEIEK